MIDVVTKSSGDPLEFEVRVEESGSQTRHRVTMRRSTYQELTGQDVPPEHCVKAAFEFLLDREPKESILGSFDITVISNYFPEFESKLPSYL